MTFQLPVKCLICRKLTETTINSETGAKAESLNLLHNKLCLALKLEFSPEYREWDFAEEPFPYCEPCGQRLQRLGELMDQLKSIEEEISVSLTTLTALVITSDKNDTNTTSDSDPLIIPKLGQAKEYFRSRRLQEKHNYFRSLITRRFDPIVNLERCDSGNYTGFLAEDYDYELLPNTLLKIEHVIPEFPDAASEESILNEAEYNVHRSSNVTNGIDPETIVGLEDTWSAVYDGPTFISVSNVSENVMNPETAISRINDLGPGVSCGSRACQECGNVFPTFQSLYLHRLQFHQVPGLNRRHCASKLALKKLKKTLIKEEREHEETPSTCLVSNAPDEEGSTTLSSTANELVKQIAPRRYEAVDDETIKTGTYHGFNFKILENGYECCTCGHVSVTTPGRKSNETNIRRHISRKHMGRRRSSVNVIKGVESSEDCGKACTTMQGLSRHCIRAHGSPKYQCGYCGQKFAFQSRLKSHVVIHVEEGKRPFPCGKCWKSFGKKEHLKRHAKVHIREREGTEMCSHCDLKFKKKSSLREHVARFHENKKISCDICGTMFGVTRDLKRHIERVHGKDGPAPALGELGIKLEAEGSDHVDLSIPPREANESSRDADGQECDTVRATSQSLNAHLIRAHAPPNQFQCGYCRAEFAFKSQLEEHVAKHIEQREGPFTCDQCGKSFADEDTLLIHNCVLSRLNYKVCSNCGDMFKTQVLLRRHIARIHKKTMWCHICGTGFGIRYELKRHVRNVHGKEMPAPTVEESKVKLEREGPL